MQNSKLNMRPESGTAFAVPIRMESGSGPFFALQYVKAAPIPGGFSRTATGLPVRSGSAKEGSRSQPQQRGWMAWKVHNRSLMRSRCAPGRRAVRFGGGFAAPGILRLLAEKAFPASVPLLPPVQTWHPGADTWAITPDHTG